MVSDQGDTGFTPLDLAAIDQGDDLLLTDLTTPDDTGAFTPLITTADSSSGILSLITLIQRVLPDLAKAIGMEHFDAYVNAIVSLTPFVGLVESLISVISNLSYQELVDKFPTTGFFKEYLDLGLGVNTGDFDADGAKGIETVDKILGFAVLAQLASGILAQIGKIPLANRFAESTIDALREVPQQMGLTWALGMTIDRAFENALGSQLDRNIRRLKRPNEPEWRIARLMLKQHILDQDHLDTILKNEGYPDTWIEYINKLELLPLPIADVSALYMADIVQEDQLDQLIRENGYDGEKLGWLKELYITKSETSSGAELRAAARQLYKLGHISAADYRDTLTKVHYPARLIDDDLQSIKLERDNGYKAQLISTIKNNLLHNPSDTNTAVTSLVNLGYDKVDAQSTVNAWLQPTIRRQHGLTEAQVLKFLAAGIIDRKAAAGDLRQLGIDSNTIQLLLDNPTLPTGTHPVKATPALVEQAYLVGAIDINGLPQAFMNVGLSGTALDYWLAKSKYAYARHHESGSGEQPLARADILEAFKYGLMDEPTAIKALNGLGYSTANATLLLDIINKGPIPPPTPPFFTSVGQAIDYLISLGLTVNLPISQEYESALTMVSGAGYSVSYPQGFIPPTENTGIPLPGGGPAPIP